MLLCCPSHAFVLCAACVNRAGSMFLSTWEFRQTPQRDGKEMKLSRGHSMTEIPKPQRSPPASPREETVYQLESTRVEV